MSDINETFIALALGGDVLMEEIDDFVSEWHKSDSKLKLHEFLGMTRDEYSLWLDSPDALGLILAGRKLGKTVEEIANDNLQSMRIAARSDAPMKIKRIQQWLENYNRHRRAAT